MEDSQLTFWVPVFICLDAIVKHLTKNQPHCGCDNQLLPLTPAAHEAAL